MSEKEAQKVMPIWKFGFVLSILMILDVITTKIALRNELVHEVNGIIVHIVENTPILIILKLVATGIIIYLMHITMNENFRLKNNYNLSNIGMVIILTFYIFVVVNNLYWMMRQT